MGGKMRRIVLFRFCLVAAATMALFVPGGAASAGAGSNEAPSWLESGQLDGWVHVSGTSGAEVRDGWVGVGGVATGPESTTTSFAFADKTAGYPIDPERFALISDGWARATRSVGGTSPTMSFAAADLAAGFAKPAPVAAALQPEPRRPGNDVVIAVMMLILGAVAGGILMHARDNRRMMIAH